MSGFDHATLTVGASQSAVVNLINSVYGACEATFISYQGFKSATVIFTYSFSTVRQIRLDNLFNYVTINILLMIETDICRIR